MTHYRRVRDVRRESLVSALNVSSFIWGIADDVLRDVYVRGQPAAGGMVGSRGDGLGRGQRGQRSPVQAARGRAMALRAAILAVRGTSGRGSAVRRPVRRPVRRFWRGDAMPPQPVHGVGWRIRRAQVNH